MKKLLLMSLLLFVPGAHSDESHHLMAEHKHQVNPEHLGNGSRFKSLPERKNWPFQLLSIGHTISSYQNYGGEAYFHHGLDIRGNALQEVRASAGGVVVNIENYAFGRLYWEVAIRDDEGFLWQYHHIDQNSIPQLVKEAFRTKGRIETGALIGKIVNWPVNTFGEFYHHIHLNILDGDGNYLNPFEFLERLDDTKAPEIVAIKILKSGRLQASNRVSGNYHFSIEVRDLILHDKFFVPPYLIRFSVDDGAEQILWQFDGLPGGSSNTDFVHDLYVANETCGNYSCRKLILDLGFTQGARRQFPRTAGEHHLDIHVEDYAGNSSSKRFNYSVEL